MINYNYFLCMKKGNDYITIRTFNDKYKLIKYLSNYFSWKCSVFNNTKENEIIDNGDIYLLDICGTILNLEDYREDAWKIFKQEDEKSNKLKNAFLNNYYKHKFRQELVPHIHKIRGGKSSSNPRIKNNITYLSDKENSKFNRKNKRYYVNLLDYKEYKRRGSSRSWKDQSKRRHQWRDK